VPADAAGISGIAVYVAYADTHHQAVIGAFPSPWMGSPNVTFIGTTSNWDAGAIRFDNPNGTPITGVGVTVDIGSQTYSLWGSNLTIPAAGSLILTETAFANFDTSDFPPNPARGVCSPSSTAIPVVHLAVGAVTADYADAGQTLNTGGVDAVACPPPGPNDESHPWTLLSGPAATPAPTPTPPVLSPTPTSAPSPTSGPTPTAAPTPTPVPAQTSVAPSPRSSTSAKSPAPVKPAVPQKAATPAPSAAPVGSQPTTTATPSPANDPAPPWPSPVMLVLAAAVIWVVWRSIRMILA